MNDVHAAPGAATADDLSIYDASAPVFRRSLDALVGILDRTIEHMRATQLTSEELLSTRLFEDMLPLSFQLDSVVYHSVGALTRLAGGDPGRSDPPTSMEGHRAAIHDASGDMERLSRNALAGAMAREITLNNRRGILKFSGAGYLLSHALPSFFFHYATAYDILRHRGVPIGKRDYLGQMDLISEAPPPSQ